jgi:Uma2 family endonuclease
MAVAERLKLTYEDLQRFPDDGKRHEIIDGEHIMTPAPKRNHQNAQVNLLARLYAFVHANNLGWLYAAPFDVVFSKFDVVEPDLVFISRDRASLLTEANVQGAPDLVVEILSPSTVEIDRQTKFKVYKRFGVREYWIVDPDSAQVEIYVARPDGYELLGPFVLGQSVRSEVLTGFACSVDEIFRV